MREPTDLKDQSWLVAIGTSGRRGTPLQGTIAEAHILVVSQAICDDRRRHDTDGKMLFHNGLIDRVVRKLGRQLSEVPVGFKWFTSELFDGSCRFGGEESAGTSYLRDDFRAPAVGVGSLLEVAIIRVSASPRRGRDAAATREAILEAATRRFATEGYQRAGAREIAADAGVTAALVNRYFGSKEKLFAEVIERALDMRHLLQGQRGDLAHHLARVMVYGQEDAPGRVRTPLLLLLHSVTEPHAVKLFRRDLDRTAIPLLAEQIGGDGAAVRAAMVMAQLTGFAIMHHVHRPKAFAKARGEELAALLSKTLAACIGSDLAGAASIPDADDARPRHASPCS